MNISITKKDAAATAASFRKAGIKAMTYAKIGNCFLDYRTAQMLNNTLRTFDTDNYSIEMQGNKVVISHGSFKGSFHVEETAKGTEIFLNHQILTTPQNLNNMDIQTIFKGLQEARQNKTMKTFVKETKESFNIDLSVQGIRSTGHHEGQVYNKIAAFERYANMEKPQRDSEPKKTPPMAPKVKDQEPSSKQLEVRAEAAQNALLQLVNNLNMLNEDKVIELINTHRPKLDPLEIREMLQDMVKDMGPKTNIYVYGSPDVTIEGITHPQFEKILQNFAAGTYAWIYGPAGSGKSYTAMQAATALNLPFYSISLCSQTTKSDIQGYMNATGNFVETDFYKAYTQGGVFCFDEFDNGNPNISVVLNAALSNDKYSFPNGTQTKHKDFRVVATANTTGNGATAQYLGRNPLDKSTTDRFCFIPYGYDPALELMMCNGRKDIYNMVTHARNLLKDTKAVVSPRASQQIYKLTAVGMDIKDAFDLAVVNKLTDNEKQILCK